MERIGLISDTHGLLQAGSAGLPAGLRPHRPRRGHRRSQRILDELAAIAPVTAVRGNNDVGALGAGGAGDGAGRSRRRCASTRCTTWRNCASTRPPERIAWSCPGIRIGRWPKRAAMCCTSTRAAPGRAASSLPISVAELRLDGGAVTPRIVELTPG